MKTIVILVLITAAFCYQCTKDNTESSEFTTGTYSGEKSIYNLNTHSESVDTIAINFEGNTYSYSGSNTLDYGRGNYLIKKNSIDFNDEEARIALYSWEWILGGTHQFRITGDSLNMNQNRPGFQVSCRLIKTAEQ
jgi:hypothetical protein